MPEAAARPPAWRHWRGRLQKRAKALGLDDEARRDLQFRVVGKESCRDMSVPELRRVIDAMEGRARGGGSGRARGNRLPTPLDTRALTSKLTALWISGYHLGVVRDRTDEALAKWLQRQTGLDAAAWVKRPDLVRAVEALESWLARDAGVDWSPYAELGQDGKTRKIDRPQARVVEAQWRILHGLGIVEIGDLAALAAYACRRAGIARVDSHLALDQGETVKLMQHFGRRIRQGQA